MTCPKSHTCLLGELKFKFRPCNSLSSLHHAHTGGNVGGQLKSSPLGHPSAHCDVPKTLSQSPGAPNKSLKATPLCITVPASPCPWRLMCSCPHLLIGLTKGEPQQDQSEEGSRITPGCLGPSLEDHSSLCSRSALPLDSVTALSSHRF